RLVEQALRGLSRALQAGRLEGVAAPRLTALEAGAEPAHTLLRGAVGESVRHYLAACLLLQAVIADGTGGIQGFFQVACLQPVMPALRVVRPDARQAVGLQLLTYQQAAVALDTFAALARRVDLGRNT